MVRPPPKFDQIFDPGCLCLEAGTQILDFKWLQGFFFGWFHLARFWEIWIASVLNTLKDGFGDNIEIICGANETFRKYPLILNYWYNG